MESMFISWSLIYFNRNKYSSECNVLCFLLHVFDSSACARWSLNLETLLHTPAAFITFSILDKITWQKSHFIKLNQAVTDPEELIGLSRFRIFS